MSNTDEEYFAESEIIRDFIDTVDDVASETEEISTLLDELSDPFHELLMTDDWLPEKYRHLADDDMEDTGEMSDDIAQWLLYRRDSELALFSLVVPPGHRTPVHDHLSWGLIGIYQGAQNEKFYRQVDANSAIDQHAELKLKREQEQTRGDYYKLIPPEDDIHSVKTISDKPSVSIHLLGTDVGCIPRHKFVVDDQKVKPFLSGYSNVECDIDENELHHHHSDHDPLNAEILEKDQAE